MAKVQKKLSTGKKVAIGATVAGLAAVAAGAYLLKTNPKAKAWARKAKKDVLEGVKKMKLANEEAYNAVVTNVMKGYERLKEVSPEEAAALKKELKGYWEDIQKQVLAGKAKAVKKAKSSVKKAVKPSPKGAKRK